MLCVRPSFLTDIQAVRKPFRPAEARAPSSWKMRVNINHDERDHAMVTAYPRSFPVTSGKETGRPWVAAETKKLRRSTKTGLQLYTTSGLCSSHELDLERNSMPGE